MPMWTDTLLAGGVSLLVAFAATPVARAIGLRLGAVDHPGGRRVHLQATPRMGGLAVLLGYLAAIATVAAWESYRARTFPAAFGPIAGLLGGGVLLAGVGAVDDVRSLGAKRKLAAQIAAASLAWALGARIEAFDLPWIGDFEFGPIASYVMTVGWILAFVNAINLIDGLDGLASGMVFFAALTNTVVAFTTDNHLAAVLNASLGGAVLAFLYYNFNPASVFLGDTGSMFVGFVLGTSALLSGRQKESTVVALLVPLIALGVPLTDTLFTMVRRFLERRPIFSPDRGHIHHRLLDLGLTHRRVVLLLYGTSVLSCVAAIAAAFGHDWQVGAALLAGLLVVLACARFAGYFSLLLGDRTPRSTESPLRRGIASLVASTPREASAYLRDLEALVLCPSLASRADITLGTEVLWSWRADLTADDASSSLCDVVEQRCATEGDQLVLRIHVTRDVMRTTPGAEALFALVADVTLGVLAEDGAWLSSVRAPELDREALPTRALSDATSTAQ